jgi:undecaprenyl phosphate N,N'-diacetylbacillosamine 1-phosphate transferase
LYLSFVKPFFDKFTALLILMAAFPLLLIVALWLVVANKGTIWFFQTRPGREGRLFRVIKFKTMTDERDKSGALLPDNKRLTSVGRFIRKTSLDELPQLINVLKGDMSIVGPRPLLEEYLSLYSAEQHRRHEVKPGITGWAQVNGRNIVAWKERFEMDIWYVNHVSFLLDLKILLLTVKKVFKAEGITSATSMTMEKFKGNGV